MILWICILGGQVKAEDMKSSGDERIEMEGG